MVTSDGFLAMNINLIIYVNWMRQDVVSCFNDQSVNIRQNGVFLEENLFDILSSECLLARFPNHILYDFSAVESILVLNYCVEISFFSVHVVDYQTIVHVIV